VEVWYLVEWILFDDRRHGSLQSFLQNYRAPTAKGFEAPWIAIDVEDYGQPPENHDCVDPEAISGEMDVLASNGTVTTADLDALARRQRCLSGKWTIFSRAVAVDRVWAAVAEATHSGRLGTSAKVSTSNPGQSSHVICVYSYDYFDSADVMRVRAGLQELNVKGRLNYKPDIYTYCGIYAKNQWRTPASRYNA
jgi:Domain of unknown function (DUF1917)